MSFLVPNGAFVLPSFLLFGRKPAALSNRQPVIPPDFGMSRTQMPSTAAWQSISLAEKFRQHHFDGVCLFFFFLGWYFAYSFYCVCLCVWNTLPQLLCLENSYPLLKNQTKSTSLGKPSAPLWDRTGAGCFLWALTASLSCCMKTQTPVKHWMVTWCLIHLIPRLVCEGA